MKASEYMPASARALCLAGDQKHVRGEPFTTLERDAQLSFILDNPSLPVGSRKTWEGFITETGSRRNSGWSLRNLAFFFNQVVKQGLHLDFPAISLRCSQVICIVSRRQEGPPTVFILTPVFHYLLCSLVASAHRLSFAIVYSPSHALLPEHTRPDLR